MLVCGAKLLKAIQILRCFKHAFERIIYRIILQLELSFQDRGILMLMRKTWLEKEVQLKECSMKYKLAFSQYHKKIIFDLFPNEYKGESVWCTNQLSVLSYLLYV